MGSGVAKAIRNKWPKAYDSYVWHCDAKTVERESLLGTIDRVCIKEKQLYVINGITQLYYGNDGKRYADTRSIESVIFQTCLVASMVFQFTKEPAQIYMPKIGCGLGGLSYDNHLKPILETIRRLSLNVEINICDI